MNNLEKKTKQELIQIILSLESKVDKALEKCYTGIRKQGGDYYLEVIEGVLKANENDN